jgi:DNA-binding NarL/FixJ family response regulator
MVASAHDGADRRVLLLEQNEVVRRGLQEMVRSLHGDGLVSEVRSATSSASAQALMSDFGPHLVIVSSDFEGAANGLLAEAPGSKVLVLVRHDEPTHLDMAGRIPANGFLMERELTVDVLLRALHQIDRGEMSMPDALARHLLSRMTPDVRRDFPTLTTRESQVLNLLAEGRSNKQIASSLSISTHGAKRHVANVLMKLNCPNRTLAVARALREDLLTALEPRTPSTI